MWDGMGGCGLVDWHHTCGYAPPGQQVGQWLDVGHSFYTVVYGKVRWVGH